MPLFAWVLFVAFLRFCFLCCVAVSGRRMCCVGPGCAVGGGPPARRPRRELRSARRLEARPGPAGPAAASNRAVLVVSVLSVSLHHQPRSPRPHRHTPRPPPPFPASLHERNTAPARHPTAWLTPVVKEISPLLAQNGQNTALFSVPGRRIFHGTPQHLTQGRFFFHPSPIPPPRRDNTRPARPHQRPSGKKFALHRQNCPKSALFR